MTRLTRAVPVDLEVRADGRLVCGIAVPFGERFDMGHAQEVFTRGAFSRTITERGAQAVKFLALHDHKVMPLGRAQTLREDAAGLYGEFRVSKTTAGDEALELIADGALDGLSVGFSPVRDRWDRDHAVVERVEVKLHEVSAVCFPAYQGARISALRTDPLYVAGQLRMLRRRLDLSAKEQP